MRSGLHLAAALLSSVAACLATAVGASAQWSPPFDLSAPTTGLYPQAAVDSAGNALVVWEAEGTTVPIQARRIDSGGALGPILEISVADEGGVYPQVAFDSAGNATVVWGGTSGGEQVVQSRRVTAAGGLEDVQDLSVVGEDATDPQVAVDPAGNATVVWNRPDGSGYTIQGRRIDSTGALGPIEDLSGPDASRNGYEVAAGPLDKAYAVWVRDDGVIQARQTGGGSAPITDLSAAGLGASRPQVAVGPSGVPTAVWELVDGTVQARRGLGPVRDLSAGRSSGPQLAVDQDGNATVVWSRQDGDGRIELRRIAADGALEQTRDLWTGGHDDEPRVAVDDLGNATIVWINDNGSEGYVARSRMAAPDGALGPTVDLSPVEQDFIAPALATSPSGDSTAVWGSYDGGHYLIMGARFEVPAPPLPALPAPPAPPPPAPAAAPPGPPPPAAAPTSCPAVTLTQLTAYTAGQPKAGSKRAKGVGSRLTLDRRARVQLLSTTLSYTKRGKARTVKLRGTPPSRAAKRPKLRFRLPGRLSRKLGLGRRVTLRVRLRARSATAGCAFGKARTLRIRTKLIWVARSSGAPGP